MILTVTANPSLDRTYPLGALALGGLNRAGADRVEASGKGVNVSRDLHAAGVDTVAVLPAGGPEGAQLCALLDRDGLAYRAVPVAGATRTNVTLALADGRTTKVNAPGVPLTGAETAALVSTVDEMARSAEWVVFSGSLPPQADPALLALLVAAAKGAGARTAVDASGPALRAAAGAGPDLLAPNAEELAGLLDRPVPNDLPQALSAAREAAHRWGTALLVSLGPGGALWVRGAEALHAMAPPVTPVNTAGAGDALLAGWLAAPGTPRERLTRAAAWGTAACLMTGTAGDVAATADPGPVTVTDLGPEPGRGYAHPGR